MSSALAAPAAPPKYRPLAFGVTRATLHETMDGTQYLMAEQPLQAFGDRMSDRLLHWARATPDTTFIAQRVRGELRLVVRVHEARPFASPSVCPAVCRARSALTPFSAICLAVRAVSFLPDSSTISPESASTIRPNTRDHFPPPDPVWL